MTAGVNTFSRYPNPFFIETGSYYGDSIQQALDLGFKKVISFELSPKLAQSCKTRFENDDRVKIIEGDSGKILGDILSLVHEPVTFWLDGHFSGGETARGDEDSPILKELEHIKNWMKEKGLSPTILIDDMRCWGSIKEDLLTALSGFEISYEDGYAPNDILIAK